MLRRTNRPGASNACDPSPLAVLARSFVEMKLLPKEPDMAKLYTEKFLPGHGK